MDGKGRSQKHEWIFGKKKKQQKIVANSRQTKCWAIWKKNVYHDIYYFISQKRYISQYTTIEYIVHELVSRAHQIATAISFF